MVKNVLIVPFTYPSSPPPTTAHRDHLSRMVCLEIDTRVLSSAKIKHQAEVVDESVAIKVETSVTVVINSHLFLHHNVRVRVCERVC